MTWWTWWLTSQMERSVQWMNAEHWYGDWNKVKNKTHSSGLWTGVIQACCVELQITTLCWACYVCVTGRNKQSSDLWVQMYRQQWEAVAFQRTAFCRGMSLDRKLLGCVVSPTLWRDLQENALQQSGTAASAQPPRCAPWPRATFNRKRWPTSDHLSSFSIQFGSATWHLPSTALPQICTQQIPA